MNNKDNVQSVEKRKLKYYLKSIISAIMEMIIIMTQYAGI